MKKGLSPVIATVLLLVIAVSMFILFKSWYVSYKEQKVSKEMYLVEKEMKKLVSNIRIYHVDTDLNRIYIINDGYKNLTGLKLYAINQSGEFIIATRNFLKAKDIWVVEYNLSNVTMLYVTSSEGVYDKYYIE